MRCVSSCCMCLGVKSGFRGRKPDRKYHCSLCAVLCNRHPSLFIPLAIIQLPFDPCISMLCCLSLGAQLLPFCSLRQRSCSSLPRGAHTSHCISVSLAMTDLRLLASSCTSEQTCGALLVYISTGMTCCRGRKSTLS